MTEKYEDFKKWFMKLEKIPTKFRLDDFCFSSSMPIPAAYATLEINKEEIFKLFEEYQKQKEKENRVKKILDRYIPEMKICGVGIDDEEIRLNGTVEECYNELKEEDLLK